MLSGAYLCLSQDAHPVLQASGCGKGTAHCQAAERARQRAGACPAPAPARKGQQAKL
jgi:hypothetical protein